MMLQRQKSTRINAELHKEKEKLFKYWTEVLKRIIAVIKFLAERGLAFRGESELHNCHNNGNYLGCIDLLAEFDPFLMEHIRKYGNPGKGNVSYMSSIICNEFIDILGSKVLTQIISKITTAKYYEISIDSTPDISHMDQLTLVIRYVIPNGNIVERFLQFTPIEHHNGKYLFDLVMNTLKLHGIVITNCRSQSYDNASNMSGIYSGVQARFREINSLADWIPCSAHSLNLVGLSAVECCSAAVNYFGIVQSVFTFFSASPQRWSKFKERIKDRANASVLQSLSETRWSARSDTTKEFYANKLEIRLALFDIAESERQPPATVIEAKSLIKILDHYETVLCVIWKDLLQQIDIANKALQQTGIELCTIIKLYDCLTKHFHETCNKFEAFESMAKGLTKSDYKECTKHKHVRKIFHDEVMDEYTIDTNLKLSASDNFRINSFYVIIDRFIIEMEKRRFSFLLDKSLSSDEIVSKANELIKIYSSDLEEAFAYEFLLFSKMFVDIKSVVQMMRAQIENKLVTSFPNVNITFRIYLSILGTNCEDERSFSKLKLIKNYLRSTMGQELLSIENDLMWEISFEDVICDFAHAKSRKVYII